MKNFMIMISIMLIFVSCGHPKQSIDEKLFTNIWKAYITLEFEESFYEKLSTLKKSSIIDEISQRAQIPAENIEKYMQQNHPDKYKRVYLDK